MKEIWDTGKIQTAGDLKSLEAKAVKDISPVFRNIILLANIHSTFFVVVILLYALTHNKKKLIKFNCLVYIR